MNKELKPCPFCGKIDLWLMAVEPPAMKMHYLECQNCKACSPPASTKCKNYVDELWNTRAEDVK